MWWHILDSRTNAHNFILPCFLEVSALYKANKRQEASSFCCFSSVGAWWRSLQAYFTGMIRLVLFKATILAKRKIGMFLHPMKNPHWVHWWVHWWQWSGREHGQHGCRQQSCKLSVSVKIWEMVARAFFFFLAYWSFCLFKCSWRERDSRHSDTWHADGTLAM